MKIKQVEWYNGKEQCLRQAISGGVEFSFISVENKQVSPFAYCKDYLQDAVQGHLLKKKKMIFGFVYDPKEHPAIPTKQTRLLVANSRDIQFGEKLDNCLDFLHQIEKDLKIKRTVVYGTSEPPLKYIRGGVWLFEGSGRWIKSPPMLSMYTLLIRLGFGHIIGTPYRETIDKIISGQLVAYQTVDKMRLKEAIKGINSILAKGDRKIFNSKIEKNYPSSIKVSTMHNTCGIIGFASERTKKHIPAWHTN